MFLARDKIDRTEAVSTESDSALVLLLLSLVGVDDGVDFFCTSSSSSSDFSFLADETLGIFLLVVAALSLEVEGNAELAVPAEVADEPLVVFVNSVLALTGDGLATLAAAAIFNG